MQLAKLAPAALAAGISLGTCAASLPLPQDGLVAHLDASDASTLTLDGAGHVLEWRSKVGTAKFAQEAGQDATNLPYFKSPVNIPSGTTLGGVVFGIEPGYEYNGVANGTDANHLLRTYLACDTSISSKEVVLVMVQMNDSALPVKSLTVDEGEKQYACNGFFFSADKSSNGDAMQLGGNVWGKARALFSKYYGESGKVWLNGAKVADGDAGLYDTFNNYRGFTFAINTLHILDAVGATNIAHTGFPSLSFNNSQRFAVFELFEVAIYDRILTERERNMVHSALNGKWKNLKTVKGWTGAGGDASWSNPSNWEGSTVPTASDDVTIGSAAVQVSGAASAASVAVGGGAVEIAAGATLSTSSLAVTGGDGVKGNGTLANAGSGTMSIQVATADGTMDASAGLCLSNSLSGTIDLCGSSVAFASVAGGGVVTNSADTAATLTITNDAASVIDAAVRGNVGIVKRGAGRLEVNAGQSYTGPTTLIGGTFAATSNYTCEIVGGLVCHLDASRLDTLTTNAAGEVLYWDAIDAGGLRFTAGNLISPDGEGFHHGAPRFAYDAQGRPAVLFGRDADGNFTGTVMRASSTVKNQALFFVSRQLRNRCGRLFSDYATANGQIARGANTAWCWQTGNFAGSLIDGEDAAAFTDSQNTVCKSFSAQDAAPHLLVVERKNATNYGNTLGGGDVETSSVHPDWVFDQCHLHEVVIFNRSLTDGEKALVQASLMAKWSISPADVFTVSNTLSAASAVEVKADSTMDFGGMAQTIPSVSFDAGLSAAYPLLSVVGGWNVTGTAVSFSSANRIPSGVFLTTTDGLTGPFASAAGLGDLLSVGYLPNGARIRQSGIGITFR